MSDYWTKAVWYLNDLEHGQGVKGMQYRGAGVKLGDANTAILWWQHPGSTTYRVIYGDLTVKDLGLEELPK